MPPPSKKFSTVQFSKRRRNRKWDKSDLRRDTRRCNLSPISRVWGRRNRRRSHERQTCSPSIEMLHLLAIMLNAHFLFFCRERLCSGVSIFEVVLQRIKVSHLTWVHSISWNVNYLFSCDEFFQLKCSLYHVLKQGFLNDSTWHGDSTPGEMINLNHCREFHRCGQIENVIS